MKLLTFTLIIAICSISLSYGDEFDDLNMEFRNKRQVGDAAANNPLSKLQGLMQMFMGGAGGNGQANPLAGIMQMFLGGGAAGGQGNQMANLMKMLSGGKLKGGEKATKEKRSIPDEAKKAEDEMKKNAKEPAEDKANDCGRNKRKVYFKSSVYVNEP